MSNHPVLTGWLSLLIFVLIIYLIQSVIQEVEKYTKLKYDNKSIQTEIKADIDMIFSDLKQEIKNDENKITDLNGATFTNLN